MSSVFDGLLTGLSDEGIGRLTNMMGLAIRGHMRRNKLTNAGPEYLNVDTGNLRSSWTVVNGPDPRDCIVGTNVEYAKTHEYGDPARNLPSRHYFVDSIVDSEREQIVAATRWARMQLKGRP